MHNDQSEEGLKPEKIDSDVRLTDVSFYYPSRPSVQVIRVLLVYHQVFPNTQTGVGQTQY